MVLEARGIVSRQLRVLIVEDSPDDALLVLHELRCGGFDPVYERVDTPEDLEIALSNGRRWDLVISDYMMPILDGVGLIRAMQENEAQRGIPCVVMTSMPESVIRSRITEYAAYVQKPFQLAAMVQLVTSILDSPQAKE